MYYKLSSCNFFFLFISNNNIESPPYAPESPAYQSESSEVSGINKESGFKPSILSVEEEPKKVEEEEKEEGEASTSDTKKIIQL